MDPLQFEMAVANLFKQKGYTVKLTPQSHDYGVDVIASNDLLSIAIQVKMYEQRQVNYRDIMYLYAGKAVHNCTNATLFTNGGASDEARRIAQKLGIELVEHWHPKDKVTSSDTDSIQEPGVQTASREGDFAKIWGKYIVPLKGEKVYTITRRENTIINVTWDYLERVSSTGNRSKLDFEIFRLCYSYILENGRMTRDEVNHLYTKRGSSIIFAVLAQIPFFDIQHRPKATLVLNAENQSNQ